MTLSEQAAQNVLKVLLDDAPIAEQYLAMSEARRDMFFKEFVDAIEGVLTDRLKPQGIVQFKPTNVQVFLVPAMPGMEELVQKLRAAQQGEFLMLSPDEMAMAADILPFPLRR